MKKRTLRLKKRLRAEGRRKKWKKKKKESSIKETAISWLGSTMPLSLIQLSL